MDRNLTREFTDAVKKQTRLYAEIKNLAGNKASAIKAGNAKKTEAVAEKEEKAITAISGGLQDIKVIFKKLSEAAGFKAGSAMPAGDILSKLDRESADEMGKALKALSAAVSSAAGPNAQNAYLLKNRLKFAGFMEALRRKIEEPENTVYKRDGTKKTEKGRDKAKIDRTI